jgi:hypothetical protein
MSSYLAGMYRDRAEECFRLARADEDHWIAKALDDLGRSMLEAAEEIGPASPQPIAQNVGSLDGQ